MYTLKRKEPSLGTVGSMKGTSRIVSGAITPIYCHCCFVVGCT